MPLTYQFSGYSNKTPNFLIFRFPNFINDIYFFDRVPLIDFPHFSARLMIYGMSYLTAQSDFFHPRSAPLLFTKTFPSELIYFPTKSYKFWRVHTQSQSNVGFLITPLYYCGFFTNFHEFGLILSQDRLVCAPNALAFLFLLFLN